MCYCYGDERHELKAVHDVNVKSSEVSLKVFNEPSHMANIFVADRQQALSVSNFVRNSSLRSIIKSTKSIRCSVCSIKARHQIKQKGHFREWPFCFLDACRAGAAQR